MANTADLKKKIHKKHVVRNPYQRVPEQRMSSKKEPTIIIKKTSHIVRNPSETRGEWTIPSRYEVKDAWKQETSMEGTTDAKGLGDVIYCNGDPPSITKTLS